MNETQDKTTTEEDIFLLFGIAIAFAASERVDLESNGITIKFDRLLSRSK